jgi:glycerophosphoryl diester phosphodiesterase
MNRAKLFPSEEQPLLFAHRGLSSQAPENTLAAFRLAARTGIPGLELDVHLTADGELAVFHDSNLKRICGLDRLIEECAWFELRDLDAGAWRGKEFAGERIPLLREVFQEFGPDFYYDVEIKSYTAKNLGLEQKLSDLIDEFGLAQKVAISSFNPFALRRFKKMREDVPTAIIWCHSREVPLFLRSGLGRLISGCDFIKPAYKEFLGSRQLGFYRFWAVTVVTWTVDRQSDARKLLEAGVNGIISNRPQDIIPLLRY